MLKRLRFPEPELPPLTEPLIVPDLVITGAEIEADQHLVRLVGWTLAKIGNLDPAERRIVVRLGVPIDVARVIWADLADALREQGGYGDRRPEVLTAHFRDKRADN
jgi:hypothetical protein